RQLEQPAQPGAAAGAALGAFAGGTGTSHGAALYALCRAPTGAPRRFAERLTAAIMRPLIDTDAQGKTVSQALIAALQNPALYPHPVEGFQVIETHISWVLLTGPFAYKIKKPVNFGFLDFTALEQRRH